MSDSLRPHGLYSKWNSPGQNLEWVNKAEIDVFPELSYFFYDPADVGILISGSSAFSKSILNIWQFSVLVLMNPHRENVDH